MRSVFSKHTPPERITHLQWLHPVGWLVWVTILIYVVFFLLGGADTVNGMYLSLTGYLVYFAMVTALLVPFFLFNIKPVRSGFGADKVLPLRSLFGSGVAGIYLVILVVRLYYLPDWQYETTRFYTPPALYFISYSGWLAGGLLIWQFLLRNTWWWAGLIIAAELALIIHTGYREWAVWFVLLVALIVTTTYRPVGNRHFVVLILLFLLIFSPLHTSYRSAASYINELSPTEQQQTSALAETPRYLLNYPEFLGESINRLRAESAMTAEIIHQVPDEVTYRSTRKLTREAGSVAIPRIFWENKPQFRPGEEIYATFIQQEDELRRTHPAGWSGEMYQHWGWGGVPAAFLLGCLLAGIWNLFTRLFNYAPGWLVTHYALIFGFTQTHLIFYASAWLRILPLYVLAGLLIWAWNHNQTLSLDFIRNKQR